MSEELKCPLCESTDIEKKVSIQVLSEPFAGSKEAMLNEHHCNVCGISADFTKENDKIIQDIVDSLRETGVINILNDFSNHGYSFAFMERALELPQRTLTKWKKQGKVNAAGVTLLRFIRLFPWLLDVAECRFGYDDAQRISVNAALRKVTFDDPLAKDQTSGSLSGDKDNYTNVFVFNQEFNIQHNQMLVENN